MRPPAHGALLGAACAVGLAAGETLLGALGGQFGNGAWFLRFNAVYAPALALVGAGAAACRLRPAASTFQLLLFAHTAAVSLQHQLPGISLLAPPRLAALALFGALAGAGLKLLTRDGDLRWLVACALSFGLPVVSALAVETTQGVTRRVAMAALPLIGLPLLGAWLARLRTLRSGRLEAGAALTAAAALASVAWLDGRAAASRYWKAEPQPQATAAGERPRPNVLLIVLDTVRAANVSAYGYGRPTTPNLDAFAREAVLYSRFVSSAPWTLPAHASLFTGAYAGRHGADRWPDDTAGSLNDSFETLAETLGRAGYATAGIAANSSWLHRGTGLDQGFREYDARPAIGYTSLLVRVGPRLPRLALLAPLRGWLASPHRSAREIVRQAESWLGSRSPQRPFFLFLNFMDAHSPYVTRLDLADWHLPGGGTGHTAWGVPQSAVDGVMSGGRSLSAAEAARLTTLYDGSLTYLDRELGRLLDHLRRRPDYGDTWIVVLSDHGEALGEHRTLGHSSTLYQELLDCPLIIKYPRALAIPPGRDSRPVQTVDILPTLLDGLGLPRPLELYGVPIPQGRRLAFAEGAVPPAAADYPARFRRELSAVLDGRFKYIAGTDGSEQLYDLASDPREENDLSAVRPDETARLREQLDGWRRELRARRGETRRTQPPLTESERERLRALGYVR